MDKRKLLGTIFGIIVWCFCILFFSYAWYTWRSSNLAIGTNSIVDEVAGLEIENTNNGKVVANNIGPVLNIKDGVTSNFIVSNGLSTQTSIYIDLTINTIDEELLSNSFEYAIVKSTLSFGENNNIEEDDLVYDYDNPVDTGNFEDFSVSTINIGMDTVEPGTVNYYKVLFYIDGSQENEHSLMNKKMTADVIVGEETGSLMVNFSGFDSLSQKVNRIVPGQPYGELPTPSEEELEEYIFEGWYLESTYQTLVTSETIVSATNNVTLYAKKSPRTYNVSYNLNGGSCTSDLPTTGKLNDTISVCPGGPTKTIQITASANGTGATTFGTITYTYEFGGWTSTNLDTATAKFGTTPTSLAAWDGTTKAIGPYFSSLKSTGGSSVTMVANWNPVEKVNLSISKTGYTCTYNTLANGTGTVYQANSQYSPSGNSSNLTLYAQCQINTYTINYDGNGSTSGSTASSTHTYGTAKNLTTNGFIKTGHYFKNWNTKSDGTGTSYSNSQSVSNLTSTNGDVITLYAIWGVANYLVSSSTDPSDTTGIKNYYETLANAISAADETTYKYIFLYRNYTETSKVTFNKNLTLSIPSGLTLTLGDAIDISSGTTVTSTGSGTILGQNSRVYNVYGNLRLTNGKLISKRTDTSITNTFSTVRLEGTGTFTMSGGSVGTDTDFAVRQEGTGNISITGGTIGGNITGANGVSIAGEGGVLNRGSGTITINNTTIKAHDSANAAVRNSSTGIINIGGTTTIETDVRAITNSGAGTVNVDVSGDGFDGTGIHFNCVGCTCVYNSGTGTINLNGGMIKSNRNTVYNYSTGTINIGGSSESDMAYVFGEGDGYAAVYNGDSTNGSQAFLELKEYSYVEALYSSAITNKGGYVITNNYSGASSIGTDAAAIYNNTDTYTADSTNSRYWGRVWIKGGAITGSYRGISSAGPNTYSVVIGTTDWTFWNYTTFKNDDTGEYYMRGPFVQGIEGRGVYASNATKFRFNNGVVSTCLSGYRASNINEADLSIGRSGYTAKHIGTSSSFDGCAYYYLVAS